VIVAARAADGLREEALADHVELFIDDVHDELLFVLLLEVVIAEDEERRGDQLARSLGGRGGGQEVAGDLLAHETVERAVGVEALDHVVAVAPGFLEDEAAQRERFGVARDIEPVTAPALAECG
jgi:hypothetical protein